MNSEKETNTEDANNKEHHSTHKTHEKEKEKEVEPVIEMNEPEHESENEKKNKTINVKGAIVLAVVIVLVATLYSARSVFVVATVNGSPISRMAVISELEKSSGAKALDALVTKKLLSDALAKSGKTVTTKEIDDEIAIITKQVADAGSGDLLTLLSDQGMTMVDLREQIGIQKQLEKVLADKVNVTDKEVEEYITSNKLVVPSEQLASAYAEIKSQLKQQKLSVEGQKYIQDLRVGAKINILRKY